MKRFIIVSIFLILSTIFFSCDSGGGVEPGTVTGLVTAPDGTSVVPGATVTITTVTAYTDTTTTGADGRYTFTDVPDGRYDNIKIKNIFLLFSFQCISTNNNMVLNVDLLSMRYYNQ